MTSVAFDSARLRNIFIVLMVGAVLLPVVKIAGPLSFDDLLPVLAITVAALIVWKSKGAPRLDITLIGFALLAAAGIISSAAASESAGALIKMVAKSSGRAAFYFVLIVATRVVLDTPERTKKAVYFLVGAGSLQAAFGLIAYYFDYYGPFAYGVQRFGAQSAMTGSFRIQGTFGGEVRTLESGVHSANFFAAYMMMTSLLTLGMLVNVKRWSSRVFVFLLAAMQLTALAFSYTRASLLALGAAVLALGWLLERRKLSMLVLVTGLIVAAATPSIRRKFRDKHDRFALQYAARTIIAESPVTGIGEGRYTSRLFSHRDYMRTPYGFAQATPHNSTLLAAAHHGLLGALAMCALYALAIVAILTGMRRVPPKYRGLAGGLGAAFVGFCLQDQVNNLMYVPKVATQLWFIYALFGGFVSPPEDEPPSAQGAAEVPSGTLQEPQ